MEFIVLDDDSTDDTQALLYDWAKQLNIITIRLRKPEGVAWRDAGAILNIGIRAAAGEMIVMTHPEVIPGFDTLKQVYDNKADSVYIAAKPYYLTIDQQAQLDTVPWETEGPLAVRSLPDFYNTNPPIEGAPDYRPQAIEKVDVWESWVFGAVSRWTMKRMGGMTETPIWGTPDLAFHQRRALLNIRNITLRDPNTYVIHQNHDSLSDTKTPRNLQLALDNTPLFTRETAIHSHLW